MTRLGDTTELAGSTLIASIRTRQGFYILAILLLSVSQTFMHMSFLRNESIIPNYEAQIRIARGLAADSPEIQLRMLFPMMVRAMGSVIPENIGTYRHARFSLAISEWMSLVFSIFGLFFLSEKILQSSLRAFLVVVSFSIFLPNIFQFTFRYGEAFIFGFFSFLVYAVLSGKQMLFVVLLFLCSFQRADVAMTAVIFKMIYDYSALKRYRASVLDLVLFGIPVAVVSLVTYVYKLSPVKSMVELASTQMLPNIMYAPYVFLLYSPVFVFSFLGWRRFDGLIYLILLSLVPYLMVISVLGQLAESRLIHPLIVTLIIGMFSAVGKDDIRDIVDDDR